MQQRVNLYEPLIANKVGPAPITLRVGVTPSAASVMGAVPSSAARAETYVLLSALPEELRRRVELAVQAIVSGP